MVQARTAGALVVIVTIIVLIYILCNLGSNAYANTNSISNTSSIRTSASAASTVMTSVASTTVESSVPPQVTITSPENVSTVNGVVNITANVIDSAGVKAVQFYIAGNLSWTSDYAPYHYLWNTTGLTGKEYIITVKAYDYSGGVGEANVLVDMGLVQHGK